MVLCMSKPIRIPEKQKEKLKEFIMKVTGVGEEEAERIERLITKYPARKIIVAINSMIQFDWKRAKKKPIPLKELEKKIRRVRF